MRGGPSNAQNIRTMRRFSRRWAIVSTPLPVRSSHATSRGPSTTKESRPRGEQLTWPSPASGAVATKNIRCARIQLASFSSMTSKTLPMREN